MTTLPIDGGDDDDDDDCNVNDHYDFNSDHDDYIGEGDDHDDFGPNSIPPQRLNLIRQLFSITLYLSSKVG